MVWQLGNDAHDGEISNFNGFFHIRPLKNLFSPSWSTFPHVATMHRGGASQELSNDPFLTRATSVVAKLELGWMGYHFFPLDFGTVRGMDLGIAISC